MFPLEKISPDSPLEGKYMLDGMFVFFICSLSLHRLFLHPSSAAFMTIPLPLCTSAFDLLLLFISLFLISLFLILFVSVSVLRVLWRWSPDSVHPVSPTRSPCSWLPAPPEACHFQGLQHTLLPRCSPGSSTTAWPGHSCWTNTER